MIIKIFPVMALWLGLMNIAKNSGLLDKLSKKISPILKFLFPEIPKNHESLNYISSNIIANMFGLGNAATPFGLKAMKSLQKLNKNKDIASRSMITFLVINTSGVTIIPTTIIPSCRVRMPRPSRCSIRLRSPSIRKRPPMPPPLPRQIPPSPRRPSPASIFPNCRKCPWKNSTPWRAKWASKASAPSKNPNSFLRSCASMPNATASCTAAVSWRSFPTVSVSSAPPHTAICRLRKTST